VNRALKIAGVNLY